MMPKPSRSRPRAPIDAYGRTVAASSGASPRSIRMRFTAAARSGAVSANVPSKSKSTAFTAELRVKRRSARDSSRRYRAQAVALRDRVVGHTDQLLGTQCGIAGIARELRGLDEAHVVVRAAGQQAQDVLGADHREEVGLRIAVDRREEHLS